MLDDKTLTSILREGHYVTQEDLDAAQKYGKAYRKDVLEYLYANHLLTPDLLGQAISEWYKIPYADLNSIPPSEEYLARIPADVALKYRVLLFSENKDQIMITTDDPSQKGLSGVIAPFFSNKKVTFAYSLSEDIDKNLLRFEKPLATRFARILEESGHVAPELLDEIFADAFRFHATDIHFEPQEADIIIRFRIDGILREAGRIPKQHYEHVLNRIKIKSRLRIDEHTTTQDGSFRYEHEERHLDMRISIVPTVKGEKAAIRILGAYANLYSLSDLGLSMEHETMVTRSAQRPYGMIVVAGPTGSGKTTTLYAVLRLLNQPNINITTIEDPVEYVMPRVNQIQVNPETDLTFARGLRSIVRQDPDVILVGEIRDPETAGIAVNAALTGHILLTTFNANDAATAIPRLLDMDIEPFLLSSTLGLVVAQRLIRTICEQCRTSDSGEQRALMKSLLQQKAIKKSLTRLYAGKGCELCAHTGYRGRTALYEMIPISTEMQELILREPSIQEIRAVASAQGASTMFEDGVQKVEQGLTTLKEVLRVVEPPVHKKAL